MSIDNLFSPYRTQSRRFYTTVVTNPGQPAARAFKQPVSIPTSKPEITSDYSEAPVVPMRQLTHKRSATQTNIHKSSTRPSSIEIIDNSQGSNGAKRFLHKPQTPLAKEEVGEKLSFMAHDGKINTNGCFFVELPVPNFIEDNSSLMMNKGYQRHVEKMVTTPSSRITRASYSTSISSHNTLVDEEKKRGNGVRKDEIPQKNKLLSSKSFKTIDKICEAKSKAQQISDQVIRQHRFIRDDEEEEANFREMYNVLNSKF